jgi:hypothetical protein
MVFGEMQGQSTNPLATRVFIPVSGDGLVQLTELSFDASRGAALFGNKEELLAEWRLRLGLN